MPGHPPLAPGWIDRPHRELDLGDFPLESGERIRQCRLSYVMHGELDAGRSNAVLVLSAIGSTHHRLDFLIGEGRALDPARYCILAVDAIGNGLSSSPSNSALQPGLAFPRFSMRDMVASQRRLLDALSIERLHAVVGASMGGMQALQWGVSHPRTMARLVAMTPMARTHRWAQLVNETARRALSARADWLEPSGAEAAWRAWVPLMQSLAGRTPLAYSGAAGTVEDMVRGLDERVRLQAGGGLAPVDWYFQSLAYDAHDVGWTPGFRGDTARALAAVTAPTLLLSPPLDLYNPVESAREAQLAIPRSRHIEIPSQMGHQSTSGAAEEETRFLNDEIGVFLNGSGEA